MLKSVKLTEKSGQKYEHKIIILGDSHAYGVSSKLKDIEYQI
jgi:hypothetical protein